MWAVVAGVEARTLVEVRRIDAEECLFRQLLFFLAHELNCVQIGEVDAISVFADSFYAPGQILAVEAAVEPIVSRLAQAANDASTLYDARAVGPIEEKRGERQRQGVLAIGGPVNCLLAMPFFDRYRCTFDQFNQFRRPS